MSNIDPFGLEVSNFDLALILLFPRGGPFGSSCGSGANQSLTLDGPYKKACDAHDKCYATCGASKLVCDLQFMMDSNNPGYAGIVYLAGDDAFDKAQEDCDEDCGKQ